MTTTERTRQTILLSRLDGYLQQLREWQAAPNQEDLLPPSAAPVREARTIAARMLDADLADGPPLSLDRTPASLDPRPMQARQADDRQAAQLAVLGIGPAEKGETS